MPAVPYKNPPASIVIHGPNTVQALDGTVTVLDPPVKVLAQIDLGVDNNGNVAFAASRYGPGISHILNAPMNGAVIPPIVAFDNPAPLPPSNVPAGDGGFHIVVDPNAPKGGKGFVPEIPAPGPPGNGNQIGPPPLLGPGVTPPAPLTPWPGFVPSNISSLVLPTGAGTVVLAVPTMSGTAQITFTLGATGPRTFMPIGCQISASRGVNGFDYFGTVLYIRSVFDDEITNIVKAFPQPRPRRMYLATLSQPLSFVDAPNRDGVYLIGCVFNLG